MVTIDYDSDDTVANYRGKGLGRLLLLVFQNTLEYGFHKDTFNVTSYGAFSNSEKTLRRRQYKKKEEEIQKVP